MTLARFQTPQVLILLFLMLMMGMAHGLNIPLPAILSDSLVRLGMNGVLVLSLVPMLNAGIGINFGLPVGIIAGLIGLCLAVNFRITDLSGFLTALGCSVPIAVIFGYGYARLLKRVAGKEEIAATFASAGLPSGFHESAAEVFHRMEGFKDATDLPELSEMLARLQKMKHPTD